MRSGILLLTFFVSMSSWAMDDRNVVDDLVDSGHQDRWNQFAKKVFALHRSQLSQYPTRREQRDGEYGGEAGKGHEYRETKFFAKDSDRLLSRVRTHRDRSDELQSVDVFIYDPDGRVVRDYSFTYLPWGRAAPVQTLINLHDYPPGLHAFRQYDASGVRLFEFCAGSVGTRPVRIELWDYEVGRAVDDAAGYQSCFAGLPERVGTYRDPR